MKLFNLKNNLNHIYKFLSFSNIFLTRRRSLWSPPSLSWDCCEALPSWRGGWFSWLVSRNIGGRYADKCTDGPPKIHSKTEPKEFKAATGGSVLSVDVSRLSCPILVSWVLGESTTWLIIALLPSPWLPSPTCRLDSTIELLLLFKWPNHIRSTALSVHTCEDSDLRKWRRKLRFLVFSSIPLCCTDVPKLVVCVVGSSPAGATPETCNVEVIMADDVIHDLR